MNKNMIIDFINRVTFTSTIKTKTEENGSITQHIESRIQLPKPAPGQEPKPVLTEPVGFKLVFEKNHRMKIGAVKRHENPECVYIIYKEYDEDDNLLTGHLDKNGNVIEYITTAFNWLETMRAFSPAFTASTSISAEHAPEMYIVKMLAATMRAFRQNPSEFKLSVNLYNKQMDQFNLMIENIGMGIANVQSKLLKQVEEEKEKAEKLEKFLDQIQQMLTENDPEKYSGLIADIRGSLGYPVEERYINAGSAVTKHRRRTRKEAEAAASDNK